MPSFIRIYWVLVLFLFSCAVQVSPSGGPKDSSAPKVKKMFPENKSTFFDGQEFKVFFDEFIILKNPEEQIVISPPLEENPEYVVTGRLLRVKFRGVLKRYTTYTVNFGNAITDNHEGNVLDSFNYVFSTGGVLDSNKIGGFVYNAFTNKPEKNILIGLYSADIFYDSIIFKTKPEYFGKSKEDGHFLIENIPNKEFVIVGFNDENKKLKYTKNEALFFNKTKLYSSDSLINRWKYHLFNPDLYTVNRLLDTFCRVRGKFAFIFYRPTGVSVIPEKHIHFFSYINRGKNNIDTLYIVSNELKNDSAVVFNIQMPDTSFLVTLVSHKKYKYPPFNITSNTSLDLNDSFQITFSNPVWLIDKSKILLKEDTLKVNSLRFILDSSYKNLKIYYPLKEKTKYVLSIKDSAFKDIFGFFNTKLLVETNTKSLKDYSSLNLKISLQASSDSYIIQLINEDETIIFKEFGLNQGRDFLFEYLLPGRYKLKVIKDENKNGLWDNGDYFHKRSPEPVFYYRDVIILKAFWDLEQSIDLNTLIYN